MQQQQPGSGAARVETAAAQTASEGETREGASGERLFLARLALIERVIAWVCARRGLRGADAEDFASVARLRLIESDYEVLRRFAGRSSLRTYLTAVVSRIYLDFQAQRFGKWRPSAEARRLGPLALVLERLLYRDGLTFDEAGSVLLGDPRVSTTLAALHELRARLPRRIARGAAVSTGEPQAVDGGPFGLERSERQALADRVFDAIRAALAGLPARERLVLRLHFESQLTLADVARTLGLEQKALYRSRDDVLRRLRGELERRGIGSREARELLATLDWEAALCDATASEEAAGPEAARRDGARPGLGRKKSMTPACKPMRRLRPAAQPS